MFGMGTKKAKAKKTYVRNTPQAKNALRLVLARVNNAEVVPETVFQEELVPAMWLWLADKDVTWYAAELAPYVLQVRSSFEESPASEDAGKPVVESATMGVRGPKPKKGERSG